MRKLPALLLGFVILIGGANLQAASAQTLEITVIDVGQGDAILIEFPPNAGGDRRSMLIDGGKSTATNNTVIQLLNQKTITTLDVVVLTHPHLDHYGGLTPVFNQFTVNL